VSTHPPLLDNTIKIIRIAIIATISASLLFVTIAVIYNIRSQYRAYSSSRQIVFSTLDIRSDKILSPENCSIGSFVLISFKTKEEKIIYIDRLETANVAPLRVVQIVPSMAGDWCGIDSLEILNRSSLNFFQFAFLDSNKRKMMVIDSAKCKILLSGENNFIIYDGKDDIGVARVSSKKDGNSEVCLDFSQPIGCVQLVWTSKKDTDMSAMIFAVARTYVDQVVAGAKNSIGEKKTVEQPSDSDGEAVGIENPIGGSKTVKQPFDTDDEDLRRPPPQ